MKHYVCDKIQAKKFKSLRTHARMAETVTKTLPQTTAACSVCCNCSEAPVNTPTEAHLCKREYSCTVTTTSTTTVNSCLETKEYSPKESTDEHLQCSVIQSKCTPDKSMYFLWSCPPQMAVQHLSQEGSVPLLP